MKKTNHILFFCLLLALVGRVAGYSQADSSETALINSSGLFPKKLESGLNNISVSGYYRFLGSYTAMKEQYPEFGTIQNALFLGDDSNIPQLMLNIMARPSKRTSFSTDLFLWDPLSGDQNGLIKGLNLGVNLNGTHSTAYGTFNVRAGGIHWHELSPMTFAANTGYNRISIFERNPWDPETKGVMDRYSGFYENGIFNQDTRWGKQAFQGFILDGSRLPSDFSFSFMHGKSQFNGGTLPTPNTLTAGKVRKEFKKGFLSLNGITSRTFADSLAESSIGFHLLTTEFNFTIKGITLYGEVGTGTYYSPTYDTRWGEAVDLRLRLPKKMTGYPLEVRYFQISPYVINNNGIFFNTSISEFNESFANVETIGGQTPALPFASSLVPIGQLTNNRRGLILNYDITVKNHKLSFGYSAAKEIQALSNQITYGHAANNLALSRFWRWNFPSNVGPYNNLNKVFRSVYETVNITDGIFAKGFNSVELNYKAKLNMLNRELYVFYLAGFHSVQKDFSALPVFSNAAYVQSYSNQIEFYYNLFKRVAVSNYFGYDRIIANQSTELDAASLAPKNQIGLSYAIGFDIMLSKGAGLYIRQRWMQYEDVNFSLDRYAGSETTVELKLYF